jgi:hypothetical protein
LALWQAAQTLPDAAFMVVKSGDATSLAVKKGGLIIEGHSKLNIGLVRVSTRLLAPDIDGASEDYALVSNDSFYRTFWNIIRRLDCAVVPRCMRFSLGNAGGEVHVNNGKLRFSGDFLTTADFVEGLEAACEANEDVKYTLLSDQEEPETPVYSLHDLMEHVLTTRSEMDLSFDGEGRPISYDRSISVSVIQSLSAVAAAGSRMVHHEDLVSIKILSEDNCALVTAQSQVDGTLECRLNYGD